MTLQSFEEGDAGGSEVEEWDDSELELRGRLELIAIENPRLRQSCRDLNHASRLVTTPVCAVPSSLLNYIPLNSLEASYGVSCGVASNRTSYQNM